MAATLTGLVRNPATGLVNVSTDDVREAERFCAAQRQALAKLLKMDAVKAENPADVALCERMIEAAKNNYAEMENLMTFPEVSALFARGALHFNRVA